MAPVVEGGGNGVTLAATELEHRVKTNLIVLCLHLAQHCASKKGATLAILFFPLLPHESENFPEMESKNHRHRTI